MQQQHGGGGGGGGGGSIWGGGAQQIGVQHMAIEGGGGGGGGAIWGGGGGVQQQQHGSVGMIDCLEGGGEWRIGQLSSFLYGKGFFGLPPSYRCKEFAEAVAAFPLAGSVPSAEQCLLLRPSANSTSFAGASPC